MESKKIFTSKKEPITRIVFAIGTPGSNCSLYCQKLAQDYDFKHIKLADLLKPESKSVFF